jgi:hypothetical protein
MSIVTLFKLHKPYLKDEWFTICPTMFVYIQTSSKGYSLFPLKPIFLIQVCYLVCLGHICCFPLQLWKQLHMARREQKLWYEFYAQNFLLHYIGQFSNRVLQKLTIMGGDYFLKPTEIGSLGVLLKQANW